MTPEEIADLVHLRRARDLIARDYAQPLDVPAMARAALMSPAHFSREFRGAYGETPYSYLMTRRVERAMALLRQGSSVTDTCIAVGCTSLGSFSSRFSEIVGQTPSQYRARDHRDWQVVPSCVSRVATRSQRRTRTVCAMPTGGDGSSTPQRRAAACWASTSAVVHSTSNEPPRTDHRRLLQAIYEQRGSSQQHDRGDEQPAPRPLSPPVRRAGQEPNDHDGPPPLPRLVSDRARSGRAICSIPPVCAPAELVSLSVALLVVGGCSVTISAHRVYRRRHGRPGRLAPSTPCPSRRAHWTSLEPALVRGSNAADLT